MKFLSMLGLASMATLAAGRINGPEDSYSRAQEAKDRILGHLQEKRVERGLSEEDARNLIVGGAAASPIGRYPYFAILDVELPSINGQPSQFFFCGSVLVNPMVVLTSADCVDNFSSLAVAVNFTNTNPDGNEQFRFATSVLIHPQYAPATNQNDLAAVVLETPVTIAPVSLGTTTVNRGSGVVMGFGSTDAAGTQFPTLLQAGTVEVLARSTCRTAYTGRYLGARMICAQGPSTDTCAGDAGGPLIQQGASASEDVLIGITSFGTGCADASFPGVYTRISFYDEFIEDAICELAVRPNRPDSCATRAPSSSPTVTGVPTGPTSSPAPSLSSAPSMAPTRKKTKFCFSGENTVETEDGVVRMDELQLGDRILSGEDNLEEIYAFGHYSDDIESEYLQLFTEGSNKPLELSADHMVFLENNVAVAASDVNTGDKVLLADGQVSTVESIKAITRKGMYAPFTESGTVSVNGVKASSFVAFQGEGFQTPFSDHTAAHMSQLPQRILARFGVKCESFNPEGVNSCLELPMKMHSWFLSLPPFALLLLLTPFIALLGVAYAVEQYPRTFMALGALAFLCRKLTARANKVKQM